VRAVGGRDRCSACLHVERAELDRLLAGGMSVRRVAERFGMGSSSVMRHKKHLSQSLVRVEPASDVITFSTNGTITVSEDVLAAAKSLYETCTQMLVTAVAGGNLLAQGLAAREVHRSLELLGRQIERLEARRPAPVIDFFTSKDWQVVIALVMEAWESYPQAKAALIKRLREVNAGAVEGLEGD
jgi:hypothetical protein